MNFTIFIKIMDKNKQTKTHTQNLLGQTIEVINRIRDFRWELLIEGGEGVGCMGMK